jgi:hypothetical protein
MAAAALDNARYAANHPENIESGIENARWAAEQAKAASEQADKFAAEAGNTPLSLRAADSADDAKTIAEAAAEAAEKLI